MENKENNSQEEALSKLPAIQQAFDEARDNYKFFVQKGNFTNQDALSMFRDRFCFILGDLVVPAAEILDLKISRDDKAMTSIKAAIAVRINETVTSWGKCETQAAATDEYKQALAERRLYYKSLKTVESMINACEQYINSIAKRQR